MRTQPWEAGVATRSVLRWQEALPRFGPEAALPETPKLRQQLCEESSEEATVRGARGRKAPIRPVQLINSISHHLRQKWL